MIRALAAGAVLGLAMFAIGNALFILGIGPVEFLIDRDTLHHI